MGSFTPLNLRVEPLAYWYLRLNGFLTTPNFVVHPDAGSNQETDIDAIGIRLGERAENLVRPMADDPRLIDPTRPVHVVLTEAKHGEAAVNQSWLLPDRRNILRVLRAVGVADAARSERIAKRIAVRGAYISPRLRVEILCLAGRRSMTLATRLPDAKQVLWSETLEFIYARFTGYHREKRAHGQWDTTGKLLWNQMERSRTAATCASSFRLI